MPSCAVPTVGPTALGAPLFWLVGSCLAAGRWWIRGHPQRHRPRDLLERTARRTILTAGCLIDRGSPLSHCGSDSRSVCAHADNGRPCPPHRSEPPRSCRAVGYAAASPRRFAACCIRAALTLEYLQAPARYFALTPLFDREPDLFLMPRRRRNCWGLRIGSR